MLVPIVNTLVARMIYKDSAKTILCYGDSNTWGANPRKDERYPRSVRWPYVLQKLLGEGYEIISEGVCGRTLVAHDSGKPWRTGITHLKSILESASPVDLFIVMLGTNDTKEIYGLSPENIAEHLQQTVNLVRGEGIKNILILCPPQVVAPEDGELEPSARRMPEILPQLPSLYKQVAVKNNCSYINTGDYIESSRGDGFHLDPEAHLKLAEVIRDKIKEIGI